MNPRDLLVRPGEPLSAAKFNDLVLLLDRIMSGPAVAAPLGMSNGAITLLEEYGAIDGITTSAFAARVGPTMKVGQVRLVLSRGTTLTTLTRPTSIVTAYNWTGSTIPTNVRVIMLRINGSYRIIAQDCSGVAP